MDYVNALKPRVRVGDSDLPERRMMYTSSRGWRKKIHRCVLIVAQQQRRTYMVECEVCNEKRNVLEEMKNIDKCVMENFGILDGTEITITILAGRWWPQTEKQEGDKISKTL